MGFPTIHCGSELNQLKKYQRHKAITGTRRDTLNYILLLTLSLDVLQLNKTPASRIMCIREFKGAIQHFGK